MKSATLCGPYDILYAAATDNILWGSKPSHLVEKLVAERDGGKVLDIGCGDGVNAIYLEKAGFSVTGYDVSLLALTGLKNRFINSGIVPNGTYRQLDISTELAPITEYDVIVSCGLYQCLNKSIRKYVHQTIQDNLARNGVVLFSCLTETIPLQESHLTEGLELASLAEVRELFNGLSVNYFREGVIQDIHEPNVGSHEHSIVWVIAKKC